MARRTERGRGSRWRSEVWFRRELGGELGRDAVVEGLQLVADLNQGEGGVADRYSRKAGVCGGQGERGHYPTANLLGRQAPALVPTSDSMPRGCLSTYLGLGGQRVVTAAQHLEQAGV
jgi:hypothetical protein